MHDDIAVSMRTLTTPGPEKMHVCCIGDGKDAGSPPGTTL